MASSGSIDRTGPLANISCKSELKMGRKELFITIAYFLNFAIPALLQARGGIIAFIPCGARRKSVWEKMRVFSRIPHLAYNYRGNLVI
jgi:hypothetical protein